MKKLIGIITILAVFAAGYSQSTNPAAKEGETIAKAEAKKAATKKLKLDVPPLQLEGTPVPVKLANLDSSKKPNPQPEVPADVTNVALNKPVTASDDFPLMGDLVQITDGDKGGSAGSVVELMGGVQWVQIDLEKQAEIFAVAVWHYHSQERAYDDVVVQLSDDPEFKKDVVTIFNADHDNSAKLGQGKDKAWIQTNEGKLIVCEKPVKARYIRLYSNGNSTNETNAYIEVEVYGR
jgi:hypothetical protein